MIQIDDVPNVAGCASCGPLIWLYSPRRAAWVAFIAAPAAGPHALRPHPCRHAQDLPTWRDLQTAPTPQQHEINAAGRRAVEQALKNSPKE